MHMYTYVYMCMYAYIRIHVCADTYCMCMCFYVICLCECIFSLPFCSYVKEPQPTVLDSMVIWYLNLMTATAQAAMPLAPQLRITLLNQTRYVGAVPMGVCAGCAESEGWDVEYGSGCNTEVKWSMHCV